MGLLTAIGASERQAKWLLYGVDVKVGKEGFGVINLGQLNFFWRLQWPEQFNWMMDAAIKMKKALKKYL